ARCSTKSALRPSLRRIETPYSIRELADRKSDLLARKHQLVDEHGVSLSRIAWVSGRHVILTCSTPLALVSPKVDPFNGDLGSLNIDGNKFPAWGYVAVHLAPNAAVERRR